MTRKREKIMNKNVNNLRTKILLLILTMALVVTMIPMNVFATETSGDTTIVASGECGEDLTWIYDSTGVLSISGVGDMDDYESYNSAPWHDYIRKSYESGTTSATKVVINEGVTSIGSYAFSYCECPIELPSTLTSVNSYAFYRAFEYTEGCELELPEGLSIIGQYAFSYSDITKVNFPSTLKTIGKNAFYDCDELKKVELNDGLENIYDYAFSGCASLEEVMIPNSITIIPDCCFSNCTSLSKIEIPDSVTTIKYRAFEGCSSLEYIDLPSGLKYISRYLFYKCGNLKEIILPNTVNSIGWHAFDGCKKLSYVKLNESLGWIESSAFYNCYDLKVVFIPSLTTYYESGSSFGKGDDSVTGEEYITFSDFTLYCLKGSKAEKNAIKYGTNYKTIDLKVEGKYPYKGSPVVPTLEIIVGNELLEEKDDYMIECWNNETIGTASVKISFVGDYAFLPDMEKIYEICNDFSQCKISLDKKIYQYHQILPQITVENNGEELICGIDYEIEYKLNDKSWTKNNKDTSGYIWGVGTGTAVVKGIGTYVGKQEFEFEVEKFDIANAKLMTRWISNGDGSSSSSSFDMKNFEYDGNAKVQRGYLVCDNNDTISSSNYEVSYRDNINPGIAMMVITGIGDYYTGSLEKTFEIYHNHSYKTITTDATLSANGSIVEKCSACGDVKSSKTIYKISSVSLSTTAYTYNGERKTPTVTVKDSKGNKLIKDKNYTVKYSSPTRKSIGRYSVKIIFKGDYSGSKTLYFAIGPKNPSSVTAKLYGYDDVKVSWKKVSGASGYKVYYKKSTLSTWSSKTATGTAIKLANLSDGVKYNIKVVTYKNVNDNKCYNAGKSTSVYTLKKVAGVKATRSGSKVKVSWVNISGETGYQISKSTKKTGTNIVVTYKTTSGKSKTISATKGKAYYYKVRAYKVVDGKKIYGPWSSVVKYKR